MSILINQNKGSYGKRKISECCVPAINGHWKMNFYIYHFLTRPNKSAQFY